MANAWAQQSASEKEEAAETNAIIKEYKVNEIVNEIESTHCKMTDKQMNALKLSADDIKRAREFCAKPTKEKLALLVSEFKKLEKAKNSKELKGIITGYNNSYNCTYWGTNNVGIPTYSDLGLSSATVIWHDAGGSTSSCRVQGAIACLWGGTSNDPLLGWAHTKSFSSKAAGESAIKPKGYIAKQSDYPNSYTRSIPYGYRYEVAAPNSSGNGDWHVEGPEPDPTFNWYAYNRGWWPFESGIWHLTC